MRLNSTIDGFRIRFGGLAVFTLLSMGAVPKELPAPASHFVLSSPDPKLGAGVPKTYTANDFGCDGGNQSPPLRWSGEPVGTKSYIITLFDPDEHSTPSGWWHWVMYDLPGDSHALPAGAGVEHSKLLPMGTLQGRTDMGTRGYDGPCPDQGEPAHRYTFTIYALDVDELDSLADSSGAMVTSMAKGHILGKAVLIAHYGR